MNDTAIKTLDHVRQFLNGLGPLEFRIDAKAARYPWIQANFTTLSSGKPRRGSSWTFSRRSAAIPGFR